MSPEDMNRLIQAAVTAEYEENDYIAAEKYYLQAMQYPDAYPVYCYGKFLVAQGREEDGRKQIERAYSANFNPAIVFKARRYIKNYSATNRDIEIEEKIKSVGEKGHLIARSYDYVLQLHQAPKLLHKICVVLALIPLSVRIFLLRLRKNQPPSIWF